MLLPKSPTTYLGTFGEALLATLATITYMSTAIGLVVAFAQDFHKRFPKISYRTFLTFNCLFSFAIANFGLTTIIAWSTPVLMFLYPLAIALIFCGLTSKFFNNDPAVYKFAVYFTIIPALFDGLNAAPSIISNTAFAKAALTFGIAGYLLGLGIHLYKSKASSQAVELAD